MRGLTLILGLSIAALGCEGGGEQAAKPAGEAASDTPDKAPAAKQAEPAAEAAVADAAENAWKHVRGAVHHIGVAVAPLGDQADIIRNRRVGGAGPLAIDDFMKVVRVAGISWLH